MNIGNLLIGATPGMFDLGLFIGRLAIGVCFVVHALGKLGVVGTGNLEGFASWLEDLGVPFAGIQARMAMASELVGGSLLTIGLFTRPACLLLVFTMVVAGRLGHRGAGYLITNDPPGAEYTINLAMIAFAIFIAGPGTVSLDALIF